MLLGHAHPAVTAAIAKQAARGTSFGATTELEVELATLITRAIPFIEKIRFVSSGTEATMSALRLARGVTKRDLLLKFEGNYHGHSDSFLSQAGSGLATLGIAECPGVPQALAALTLNAPYNDLNAVERIFTQHKNKIAADHRRAHRREYGRGAARARISSPVLREISRKNGALLIVDEVITGFRLHNGAAQQFMGIEADLTTFGKIIGGGVPVAAYGGRAELMNQRRAARPGLSGWNAGGESFGHERGNRDAKTIGSAGTLRSRSQNARERLADGLRDAAAQGRSCTFKSTPSARWPRCFSPRQPVRNYSDAKKSDTQRYGRIFPQHAGARNLSGPIAI